MNLSLKGEYNNLEEMLSEYKVGQLVHMTVEMCGRSLLLASTLSMT